MPKPLHRRTSLDCRNRAPRPRLQVEDPLVESRGAIAVAVYDLADSLVQLWYFAERQWCDPENDQPVPENVDVRVGRALELAKDIARDKDLAEPVGALLSSLNAAWQELMAAWQGKEHRQLKARLRDVDPEFQFEQERLALNKSPLAGAVWKDLESAATRVQTTLAPTLRNCFQVSFLTLQRSHEL